MAPSDRAESRECVSIAIFLASAIRAAIQQIDPDQPVFNVKTMSKVVSDSARPYWFSMSLLGVFALLALVLAGVGIYGLTSRRHRDHRTPGERGLPVSSQVYWYWSVDGCEAGFYEYHRL